MTRPTDWHVLDLDGDPTPGDPARLRQLASRFHDFADTAHRAKLAVESLQGDGALLAWVGKSGDAFREQFGDFPNQVNKLYRSHLMVGDALDAFAPELERAQAQADRALADGRAAAEKLISVKGTLSIAEADFTGASKAAEAARAETVKPDPDQVKQAVRDATVAQEKRNAAQGGVNAAQGELDLAKQLAEQARQMRDGAARTCVREIEDASDAGIQPRNFWQKLGDAFKEIWNIICEVAKWVALVAGIIGMILGGPAAWIALAAGAILLIKAIVDYTQGKGSVADLVMGLLGVIPGVKGLTSLSKLSALYKAGGVKEIAKATLTGMKNMAHAMVNLVKAAGTGALTLIKTLGDGATAALAGLTNVNKVVTGAIDTGKVGDFIPAGLPKAAGDVPGPGATKLDEFGMPAPHTPGGGAAPNNFTQKFKDLDALKVQNEQQYLTQIKTNYTNDLQNAKLQFENTFKADLKVEVDKINADHLAKLNAGKLNIENTFKADLKVEVDKINVDALAKLNVRKAEIDTNFANLKQTQLDELRIDAEKKFNLDELNLNNAAAARDARIDVELKSIRDQATEINTKMASPQAQADMARFNQIYGPTMRHLDAENVRLIGEKADVPTTLANDIGKLRTDALADLSNAQNAAVKNLDIKHAEAIAGAEKQFGDLAKADIDAVTKTLTGQRDIDVANLTSQLDSVRNTDISTVTTRLEGIRDGDINTADLNLQNTMNTDTQNMYNHMTTWYNTESTNLNNVMLDSVAENFPGPAGNIKVLHENIVGADPTDFSMIITKNVPRLDEINPNKLPTDVNCTLCVQRVNDYLTSGTFVPAPKLAAPQPLHTITANYPGMTFNQVNGYADVITDMAARPNGTIAVIGVVGPSLSGHVMNVVNVGGRVVFLDGQTGRLANLPHLKPTIDQLHYAPFP